MGFEQWENDNSYWLSKCARLLTRNRRIIDQLLPRKSSPKFDIPQWMSLNIGIWLMIIRLHHWRIYSKYENIFDPLSKIMSDISPCRFHCPTLRGMELDFNGEGGVYNKIWKWVLHIGREKSKHGYEENNATWKESEYTILSTTPNLTTLCAHTRLFFDSLPLCCHALTHPRNNERKMSTVPLQPRTW